MVGCVSDSVQSMCDCKYGALLEVESDEIFEYLIRVIVE